MKNLVAGAHPMDLKKGMDIAVDCCVKYLKQIGKPLQFALRAEQSFHPRRTIITRDHTALMMDHQNNHERVTSRINDIQYRLKQQPTLAEKKIPEERLARLQGMAAVLSIGANTGMELRERKARAENALKAAKAALQEGVLPGGGVAFIRARNVP